MSTQTTYVGRREYNLTDLSAEYLELAQGDEKAGLLLIDKGEYRHGIYFLVQAMEKYVRSVIFSLVNPETPYFRSRTQTHKLDELLTFLLEIVCPDKVQFDQINQQLERNVLRGVKFRDLHNDLRYPSYDENRRCYRVLHVNHEDAEMLRERMQTLKRFLQDIHQLRCRK